ncbi:MAG: VCBS repeat-containing protein [Proteobacteria bacterium]|nr:VCBS repeat-containing protein [Pseudomonadota bacterium]MCP4921535.1 VCBS repeat-containing protein [Pseudomonadota bacterium]
MLLLALACSDYELSQKSDVGAGEDACPIEDAPVVAIDVDESCAFDALPGGFDPVVEWRWEGSLGAPGHDDVMMMPVVGDVDADGLPEVVFTSYAANQYGSAGALHILEGTGEETSAFTSIGGYAPVASSGVALGDLEGDGVPEILVMSTDTRVLALHADGTLVWASESLAGNTTGYGYPVVADLDGDGLAEVVSGRVILDHTGATVGVGAYGQGGVYAIPVVADLDLDGNQEVLVGNAAYKRDGTAKWVNDMPDGWSAVADFDLDGFGEVVSVQDGAVWLADTDGTILWSDPSGVPGGGGGPPTIADFDGDGLPEIGTAGYSGYVVHDTDGTQLWLQTTQDQSSARTGSAVFDFEGDGQAEVVYADELALFVYDGATGAVLMAEENHSSWTLFEYPAIVDVDADGEAEIILASNDSIDAGWQGITAIGDLNDSWAPTTQTWNQHAYHITNAADDLSIPAEPLMNWQTGHNSYRAGGLRERDGIPAPNLRVEVTDICWDCLAGTVDVSVQVFNDGLTSPGDEVDLVLQFREAGGSLRTLEGLTIAAPAIGESSPAMVFHAALPEQAIESLRVEVDPGDELTECHEDDNAWVEALDCSL